jgi:murein L,D-transpeptidase YafK
MKAMLRMLVLLIIVGALAAGGYLFFTTEGRQLLDRSTINFARMQNQRTYRAGKQLPGTPDLARFDERLEEKGLTLGAPVFIRIFKLESELEVWMEQDGRYRLFATYPICLWSGRLGPKLQEGDKQAPEGFYSVSKEQLNPNSRWHRSFNLGFPNDFDRAHGRTGSFLMVHGGCLSVGCYAMTDPVVDEIWRLVTAALDRGQPAFDVQVFPFRMTEQNLRLRSGDRWSSFWADLKQGYDLFEQTKQPPHVGVCDGRYVLSEGSEPPPPPCQGTAALSKPA